VGSDAGLDDASVVGLALAGDDAALFHAVEQAGHIRVVRNHAVADAAAGQTAMPGAAKNAQDVVLSTGKTGGFQELFSVLAQGVGGFQESHEDAGFERSGRGFGARIHNQSIVVVTIIVKRKCGSFCSGLAQGPEVDLAEETLRPLGEDGFDGVGHVLRAEDF